MGGWHLNMIPSLNLALHYFPCSALVKWIPMTQILDPKHRALNHWIWLLKCRAGSINLKNPTSSTSNSQPLCPVGNDRASQNSWIVKHSPKETRRSPILCFECLRGKRHSILPRFCWQAPFIWREHLAPYARGCVTLLSTPSWILFNGTRFLS